MKPANDRIEPLNPMKKSISLVDKAIKYQPTQPSSLQAIGDDVSDKIPDASMRAGIMGSIHTVQTTTVSSIGIISYPGAALTYQHPPPPIF